MLSDPATDLGIRIGRCGVGIGFTPSVDGRTGPGVGQHGEAGRNPVEFPNWRKASF